jgi:hypothetical protein
LASEVPGSVFGLDRQAPFVKLGKKGGSHSSDRRNGTDEQDYGQDHFGTLTSPFVGTVVAAQPPRRLQLSLRMRF